MVRRMFQLLVAVMVTALPLVVAVAPARADNAGILLGLVNTLRAAHGVGPLTADPELTRIAQAWSAHMAYGYGLSHNPDLYTEVSPGWSRLGENAGEGGNILAVYTAFINSALHLGNMLDARYNLTGIAVAVGRLNTLWVTQDFEARAGATPATTRPPTTSAPTTRPAAATTTTRPATPTSPTSPTTATVPAGGTGGTGAANTTTETTVAGNDPSLDPAGAVVAGGTGGPGDPTLIPGIPGSDATPRPTSGSPAPDSSSPGNLAVGASAGHGAAGGSSTGWILGLAALAVVVLAGGAVFLRRLLR